MLKLCIHCNKMKPLEELKIDKGMQHGRSSMCYLCYKAKYRPDQRVHEPIIDLLEGATIMRKVVLWFTGLLLAVGSVYLMIRQIFY